MPQKAAQQKKKKKGHSPAHQNTFSFQHNPKSKKTAAILATPIEHVCRRCRDKLEWRKQYRKYKPRTTPGKCNHCQKRNVRAAYHTVCERCTRTSPKSLKLLKEWNAVKQKKANDDDSSSLNKESAESGEPSKLVSNNNVGNGDNDGATKSSTEDEVPSSNNASAKTENESATAANEHSETITSVTANVSSYRRVCAMCAKEPALPGPDDYEDDDADGKSNHVHLSLRERRSLARRRGKAAVEARQKNRKQEESDEGAIPEEGEESEGSVENSPVELEKQDEGDEDPFLKAIGGADKLLTGEAYQEMLLQRETTQSAD